MLLFDIVECRSDFKANWPNVDTLNLLRRLGVPSAVGLPQIQNQRLTSLVAQMKKLWTYRSCPKRWTISLHYITVIKNASIFRKCQNMGKRHLEMCRTSFSLCSINIGFPKCGLVVDFIRRRSDHCLLLSVTTWLTDSCLWDLNDVTLVDEYGKLQWQRKLGPKWDADVWLRFWGWIWFWRWFLVNVLKPKFGQE